MFLPAAGIMKLSAWEEPARGALRATTAMQERSCRQPAKPFRWRAVVTARLP
jgi:hypothetical protein